jgi:hypothetical protein
MVLDTLSIVARSMGADAKREQQPLDDAMLFPRFHCDSLACPGQENAAVGAKRHEAIVRKALQHLGDRRLGDAKARCDIDLPGLATGGDQIRDELDIIGCERRAARRAGVAETQDVLLHLEERLAILAILAILACHPAARIALAVEIA